MARRLQSLRGGADGRGRTPLKERNDPAPGTPGHMHVIAKGSDTAIFRVSRDAGSPWVVKQAEVVGGFAERRLEAEYKMLRSLSHENIVRFRGAGKWGIATKDFGGECLQDFLEAEAETGEAVLSYTEKLHVLEQTCRALIYLHARNIIHGDLKADNILLAGGSPGDVKLCDFGCAMVLDSDGFADPDTQYQGNAYWTAPEALGDDAFGMPADIWAFGVTAFQVLTCEAPYLNADGEEEGEDGEEDDLDLLGTRPVHPLLEELAEVAEVAGEQAGDGEGRCLATLLRVFQACTETDPDCRPTAPQVLGWLSAAWA